MQDLGPPGLSTSARGCFHGAIPAAELPLVVTSRPWSTHLVPLSSIPPPPPPSPPWEHPTLLSVCLVRRCGAAGLHAGRRPPSVLHHAAGGGRRRRGGLLSAAVELQAGHPLPKAMERASLQVPGPQGRPCQAVCLPPGWLLQVDWRLLLPAQQLLGWVKPASLLPSVCPWRRSCCFQTCRTQPYLDSLEDEDNFLAGADDMFLTIAESPDSSLLCECLPQQASCGSVTCGRQGMSQSRLQACPCAIIADPLQWCMGVRQTPQVRPAETASWPTS